MKNRVFVYGTLMKGMSNHHYLSNSNYLGQDELNGYIMYDLGYYPGIIEGNGKIIGEVYEIDNDTLDSINMLEGEGYLYIKKEINTKYGVAYIYVYNKSVEGMTLIPYEMQPYNNLVYYVAYGSNMLMERFMNYVAGGYCRFNEKHYKRCKNNNRPIKFKSIIIPYNMYYSMKSNTWKGSISFIDINKKGKALARAYLITKEQLKEIQCKEGIFYDRLLELDSIDGFKTYSFTSSYKLISKSIESVSDSYKKVLEAGIKESFPDMTDEEINIYLIKCGERGNK